ncbi:TPA: hypothetical protein ACPH2S_001768 [Pseudomonas aeruginosa]
MKTQAEIYELVRAGRKRMKELPSRNLSKSTDDAYVREYNRLVGDEGAEPEKLWSAICRTSSKSTYRRRVAAVMHCCKSQLFEALRSQDAAQRAGDMSSLREHVSVIEGVIGIINIVEQHKGKSPLDTTVRRKSKRSDLKKLPNNWREQLYKQFALSRYAMAYLVEAVSGCRPGELEKGVKVICTEEGRLIIRIDNGVKVTEERGQPWREISYQLGQGAHPLIRALFDACRKPEDVGEVEMVVRIEKSTNWRAALSSAGRKLWPQLPFRICPYHLRNAAASDFKRSDLSDEKVSAALGHCVNKTASLYGQFQIGRGGKGLSPEMVNAARPVLDTRSSVPTVCLSNARQPT